MSTTSPYIGTQPDAGGHFGPYGGRYIGETLAAPIDELKAAWEAAKKDPAFDAEFRAMLRDYAGRPSPLDFCERLTAYAGGPRIFLKREDCNHTGAHKINNVVGQGLLARRMGKTKVIAETGAGQHGVATATIAARLGWSARCSWARRTSAARPRTCSACGCSARRSWRSSPARRRSRTR